MMEEYSVYKHTNVENGKVYYGIAQNCLERWNDGVGYQSNKIFWKDVVKFGWRNFTHEIIKTFENREDALWLESLLIQETKSYIPENGYNQNYQDISFRMVEVDDSRNEDEQRIVRRGGGGHPVMYNDEYYPTISMFCRKYGYDSIYVSQGLNPNASLKLKGELRQNLRYATEDEISKFGSD